MIPGPSHDDDAAFDLTIVVPCLNEEKNIDGTLETIRSAMSELPYRYEVLVIDDGSSDGTGQVVKNYIEAHREMPIRLHTNSRNRGLTRSYVDGAFLGQGKYYRLVCGDNVEPKETLLTVFRQMGKAEMVIPYHPEVPGKSKTRLWISGLYTRIVNLLSGYQIRYYNGLAIHLRYNVMRWGPYSFGFGFQAELVTRLLDEGATYIEIPVAVAHKDKSGGNSALNIRNFMSVTHTLLEVFIRRVRKRMFQR